MKKKLLLIIPGTRNTPTLFSNFPKTILFIQ